MNSAHLGIITNQFYFDIEWCVSYLNVLQVRSFKL